MYTYYLLTVIDIETEEIIYESALLTKKTLSTLLKLFNEDDTRIIIEEKNYSEPVWWLKEEKAEKEILK